MQIKFQPKGIMCSTCKFKDQSCNHLLFMEMSIAGSYIKHNRYNSINIQVIECTHFQQKLREGVKQ